MDVLSNMYTCREHGLAYKVYCEQEGCDMMLCSECFVRDHFGHSIVTLEKRYEVVAEQVGTCFSSFKSKVVFSGNFVYQKN